MRVLLVLGVLVSSSGCFFPWDRYACSSNADCVGVGGMCLDGPQGKPCFVVDAGPGDGGAPSSSSSVSSADAGVEGASSSGSASSSR